MRPSPLLRQITASTARIPKSTLQSSSTTSSTSSTASIPKQQPQRKLPLPQVFHPGPAARLRRAPFDFLPSLINAPTTFPPLFIPPPEVNPREWFATGRQTLHKLRSYYLFYKTGMKQFNQNRYDYPAFARLVNGRKIRKILKKELMGQLGKIQIPGTSNINLCRIFGLVVLIFGEFTPIIAWLVGTRFFPGTCITKPQLDRRRRKRMDNLDRKRLPVTPRVTPTIQQVNQLPRQTIIHECRILGVCSPWTPIILLPTIYLREMLIRRINYLEYDDELIRKFARPDLKDMNVDEIKLALEERGVSLYNVVPPDLDKTGLLEKSPEEIYKLMIYWLKLNANKHPERPFTHEIYLKEMIRFRRLPDL